MSDQASEAVRRLLDSDRVTPITRQVLTDRLAQLPVSTPRFFDQPTFQRLIMICDHLIPQLGQPARVDLAGAIDTRLADQQSDGWRYATLPADAETYRRGLHGIDETARSRFDRAFEDLSSAQQTQILQAVQHGEAEGATWQTIDQRRFFEELLAETVECYYSHPLVQQAIGYVGMADAHGWQAIGLNERDPHEPPTPPLSIETAHA